MSKKNYNSKSNTKRLRKSNTKRLRKSNTKRLRKSNTKRLRKYNTKRLRKSNTKNKLLRTNKQYGGSACKLKKLEGIAGFMIKPVPQCETESPFIIPVELGKSIVDLEILEFLFHLNISINGLSKETVFIYISSGTQGSVWKFIDLDGSLKILKIPNLQTFRPLFVTTMGKLDMKKDFDWTSWESRFVELFNGFSIKEFDDFNELNTKLNSIAMDYEQPQIKSTNTELRTGVMNYNNTTLGLKLVVKDYIDGIEPTDQEIEYIISSLDGTGIHDIKKDNIIKKDDELYIIDFLL
jgi:hypothetical protein